MTTEPGLEPVQVDVRIPLTLRRLTGGASSVRASGRTVAEVIDDLERQHTGLRDRLLDGDGKLHRFMNVYRNGEDVRYQGELAAPLVAGDRLQIVPAAAGG